MTKVQDMTVTIKIRKAGRVIGKVNITGETLLALRSCGTSRQGMTPQGRHSAEALSELARLGLIGPKGGLTQGGSFAYLDSSQQIEDAQDW